MHASTINKQQVVNVASLLSSFNMGSSHPHSQSKSTNEPSHRKRHSLDPPSPHQTNLVASDQAPSASNIHSDPSKNRAKATKRRRDETLREVNPLSKKRTCSSLTGYNSEQVLAASLNSSPPPLAMNTIIWNCQGMGNPLTIRHLKNIYSLNSPECIFLSEIKQDGSIFKKFLRKCIFDELFIVPSQGTAGGLTLAWKQHINIHIIASSLYFIQAHITNLDGLPQWQLIGLHLHHEITTRITQFHELSSIIHSRSCPILIGGDFNVILCPEDKAGGASFHSNMVEDMQEFINSGYMLEFPTAGPPFTSSNRLSHPNFIEKVLDRFLANSDWHEDRDNWQAIHLDVIGSDHRSILLQPFGYRRKKAPFKFNKCWNSLPQVHEIITHIWQSTIFGSPQYQVHMKLKAIRATLIHWSKENKLNSQNQSLIANLITEVAASFFRNRRILKSINHTHIAMISKVKSPQEMTDIRPITLSNFTYNIFSKILVHRVQPIMDLLISDNQSAFIKNRRIFDNIPLSHELNHYLQSKQYSRSHEMAVKLDMSKAFDRLEWSFISSILTAMGFHKNFIKLILQCIQTVSYFVLIDGHQHLLEQTTQKNY
ncbi:hypothetical protein Cni_G13706 [Canna indica]|uniref:Reverse transcriptase domain-containing protein n=1 Tax=Canna indica TaxID=4628 RepID=A0AAQ3KA11_9LILI|nr:hypothetical protein Cni_G13706 [Canna indica]